MALQEKHLLEGAWWDIDTMQSYNNTKRYFSSLKVVVL
jgi:hypothetical protein